MTKGQQSAVNCKVAEALGREWLQTPEGDECLDSMWIDKKTGRGVMHRSDFCADASATDLVIREARRRGWPWAVGDAAYPTPSGEYVAYVGKGNGSGGTWMIATCLAFLAAHDAEKGKEP